MIAGDELILFAGVTLILLYLSAVGIYYFEHAAQPEKFASVFHALWWAVATMTTVGYAVAGSAPSRKTASAQTENAPLVAQGVQPRLHPGLPSARSLCRVLSKQCHAPDSGSRPQPASRGSMRVGLRRTIMNGARDVRGWSKAQSVTAVRQVA